MRPQKQELSKLNLKVNSTEPIINAIRRAVNEIFVPAIEEIEVIKNDSALYDEVLAHRLGLIPLVAEKSLKPIEECSCNKKRCGKCTIKLKLQAKGPGIVYSSELKGTIKPVIDNIPIVYLEKDQEIEILAIVRLGKGQEHAKFIPGIIYYRPIVQVELPNKPELLKKCASKCPKSLIREENGKFVVKNSENCDSCGICVEICPDIKLTQTGQFIVTIESWGQISPKEIFTLAIEALESDLKEISKKI